MIISSYYILLTTGPVYIFLLLRHHIKKETEQLLSSRYFTLHYDSNTLSEVERVMWLGGLYRRGKFSRCNS